MCVYGGNISRTRAAGTAKAQMVMAYSDSPG